jgi:riboflavin synthase
MFSGITETIGTIEKITPNQGCKDFLITPEVSFSDINNGDSISVNGVCLTVTEHDEKSFSATAVPETLNLTNLNTLIPKNKVNLERSMRVDQRLGGHFVQGHVDGMGKIIDIQEEQGALRVVIEAPKAITSYLVHKGFIAIDGMSITLIDPNDKNFSITFIPYTIQNSLVKYYTIGAHVNLEVDMFAKMIHQQLLAQKLLT